MTFPGTAKIQSGNTSSLALSIALVSLILLPKVGMVDFSVIPLCLLAGVVVLLSPWTKIRFELKKEIAFALGVLIIIQVSALASSLVHQSPIGDDLLYKPIRQIIIILSLLIVFHRYKIDNSKLLDVILYAAVINGLVIFLQYYLHNAGISEDFLIAPGFDLEDVNSPFRKPGLINGYPPSGLLQVYGTIVILDRLRKDWNARKIILFLICSLSVFLTSRMALLMLFSVFGLYIFISLKNGHYRIPAAAVFLGALITVIASADILNHDTIDVMFDIFINYLQGEGFYSQSGSALADSYAHWPQSASVFIFGNGLSATSDSGYTVDSSAQIILFGGGLIPLVLYNVLLLYYFYVSGVRSPRALIVILLFVLDIISNIKVNTLFSRVIGDILLMVFVWSSVCLPQHRQVKLSLKRAG